MTTATAPDTAAIKSWLLDLQSRIVTALETLDGLPFRTDELVSAIEELCRD